ncbi:MAG: iron complex outermembrane receptor protein [Paraglaciecola sp.]|jgi:iron complex outermembrane receptor protein
MSHNLSTHFKRNSLSVLVGLSLALQSGLVLSQEVEDEEDGVGVERIMITASKRSTGLQETPIAVTVVGSQDIEQAKVLDIGDLQTLVPTLRVTPLQRSTNTNFSIRGFGNGTNNTGIEPSVGIFIDGVYRSRAAAQIGDLPRLQQVEVLSGPQSTLFGKNASAGVISVRTEAPSYDLEGKVEAGLGNFNQRLLKGYVTNGVTDTLALSLSAGINTRDGFTDSIVGLGKLNDRDRWNIRGQALYEPMEDVTVRFIADYSEIDENCCTVADVINGPTTGAVRALGGVVLDESDPFAYQSALNTDPRNQVEDGGVSLQVDIDFEGFAFTSITAFRNNESQYLSDVDFTSLDILTEEGHTKIDTFTQEFRLTSIGERKLDWMVGGFFFQEDVDTGDTLFYGNNTRNYFDVLLAGLDPTLASFGLPPGILGNVEGIYGLAPGTAFFAEDTAINSEFIQANDAYSFFVNLDYHLNEAFTATLGMSYTNDEKDVGIVSNSNEAFAAIDFDSTPTAFGVPLSLTPFAGFIPFIEGLQFLPPQLDFPNSVEDGKSSDSKTTWSVRLAYELNRNINFFATAATGFKATSWNLSRDTRPFPDDESAITTANLTRANQSYGTRFAGPEEATVYELGMKSSFKNGAFNVTLFNQTIEGFQSSIFVGTGFVLANAGEQNTKGIEFDSRYWLTEDVVVTLAGTLLDPEYVSFEGASGLTGPVDLSGTQPAGIHEQSITAGITYNFEFENGMFGYVRTDYIYESEAQIVENVPESMTREVSTFNASAGLNLENGVNIQLWIRNLNNDEYFMSAFPPPIQAGSFDAYPNQPRTFGATVSYEF